jgi:hypothetical protein
MDDNKAVVDSVLEKIRGEISEISDQKTRLAGSYQANFTEMLYGYLLVDESCSWHSGSRNPEIAERLKLGQGVLTLSDLQWKRKGEPPYFDCSIFEFEGDGKRMNFHGYVDSRWYSDRVNLIFNSRRSRVRSIYDLDDQASTIVIGNSEEIVAAFNNTLADSMFKLLNKYIVSDGGQYRVKHI